jgi:YggT family protein
MIGWLFDAVSLVVLARVVLSWVAPHSRHPLALGLKQVTEPVLAPIRRLIPPMGGLDFSPMLLLIALQLIRRAFLY